MTMIETILLVLVIAWIIAPISSYFIVKYGVAGYFQARRREQRKTTNEQNP